MIIRIKNLKVIIDDEDFYIIAKYNWSIVNKKGTPYVFFRSKDYTHYLAREILNAPKDMLVDHIDGNTLNNARSNLRLADKRKNAQNMKANTNTTSVYKGVCWDKIRKKWRANIRINDKQTHLGRFELEIDAAKSYNEAAKLHFGEFARLNEIKE